jgi:hypothetical protein
VNVDEMDLAREALDVTPWRPEAYERARTELRAVMTESQPGPAAAPARERRFGRPRNRRGRLTARGKAGLGAGIAAIAAGAAAAALVLAAGPAAVPAVKHGAAPRAATVTNKPAPSKLMTLAALIKTSDPAVPGNASLAISTQVNGGKLMQVLYAVYTDDGRMYTGDSKQTLVAAIAQHANQADSTNAAEIAAAVYAADGDLATGRAKMVNALPNCFGVGLSPAAQKKFEAQCWAAGAATRRQIEREKGIKTPLKMPTGQALQDDINNYLWTASTIALNWGGGNPQIRAGVLRLLSTIPQVTVADSTTGGQPTLTITAGTALFDNSGDQVLTVSAATGIPVSSVESGGGLATAVETDHVSRVTLADIAAGKF